MATEQQEVSSATASESEFVISHVFDAPRGLVWQAWTEADRLSQWWGPKGCTLEVKELDFRPGGLFHYSMHMPDGNQMFGKFAYEELDAPERLVFTSSFADDDGNTIRAPFSELFPIEIHNTLTFSEHEGRTTLTMRGVPLNASEAEQQFFKDMNASMQQGWSGTLEQLTQYLQS
jgi:uncharacterized protein YndB with AHSA1/START domain